MSLFADDAKVIKGVKNEDHCNVLQRDLDTVWGWSEKWDMEFTIKKCSVIEFEKSAIRVKGHYKLFSDKLDKKTEEKHLRVVITDNLSPERHVNKITPETTTC